MHDKFKKKLICIQNGFIKVQIRRTNLVMYLVLISTLVSSQHFETCLTCCFAPQNLRLWAVRWNSLRSSRTNRQSSVNILLLDILVPPFEVISGTP